MGKNNKNRGAGPDWEEMASDGGHESGQKENSNDNNGSRKGGDNGNGRSSPHSHIYNGEDNRDQRMLQVQSEVDFGLYLEVVDELKTQLLGSQKALKKVYQFYTRQEQEIQEVVKTKERLEKLTVQNKDLKTTVDTLQSFEKEKNEKYMLKIRSAENEGLQLRMAKEKAEEDQRKLEEERENFKKRMRVTEAEQAVKLDEQRAKLGKEQDERYIKRVEILEGEMKGRQDQDKKRIADLEAENNKLSEKLEEQRNKLKKIESKCKDAEKLKELYEGEVEDMKRELKRTENEFGLNTGSTEFYKGKFLRIYDDIQDISSRYVKELDIGDLDTVHDKIEKVDSSFTSVPISRSRVSEELRVAHAQRVISSQLRDIIWQPFSSEVALQESNNVLLLNQICNGLAKSSHGGGGGHRAARVYAALTMRGLQSQLPPSNSRAEAFTDKVMAVLSLLVKPSLHLNLRSNLFDIATSAVSLWDTVQTDEREFIVHNTLDPASYEEWHENMPPPSNGIIVLLPRVIARRYPRIVDNRPIGPPGMWIDSEPESHVEETCIYGGKGLAEWSALVVEGEDEEDERKAKQEREKDAEKKRVLEEELKRLEKQTPGHKRRISQSRRESTTGSGLSPSNPSTVWMKGGGQKIPEGED